MNNAILLALVTSALTVTANAQPDTIDLTGLTTGSVVRVSARQPVVTLGHADVLSCTTNELVVRQSKQTYSIQATNLVDLEVLVHADPAPAQDTPPGTAEPGKTAKPSGQGGKASPQLSMLTALWDKITSLWR